jgi:hypothetical protein
MLIADNSSIGSSYKQEYNVLAISRAGINVWALMFYWCREVHNTCKLILKCKKSFYFYCFTVHVGSVTSLLFQLMHTISGWSWLRIGTGGGHLCVR